MLLASGKPKEAIDEFQKAIALDMNNTDAIFYTGQAYLQMGQFDMAIQNYQRWQTFT
jgi:tetratricopeptide (TPR) repeat protein